MTQQWDEDSKKALIAYRLNRSDETMLEADLMYNEGLYHGAINRLYYACFYVTTALLLKNGIQASTHSGVKTMFALHFVSKGVVSYETGKVLSVLFEKRQTGDYDDFVICSQQDVCELMQQAKVFVRHIKSLIND